MCSCCCGSKSRFSASADQRQLRLSGPGRLALKASHIQHNQPLQPELHPGQPANDSRPGLTTSNAILLWPIFHTTKPCSQPATHSRAGPPAAPPPLSSWCPPLQGSSREVQDRIELVRTQLNADVQRSSFFMVPAAAGGMDCEAVLGCASSDRVRVFHRRLLLLLLLLPAHCCHCCKHCNTSSATKWRCCSRDALVPPARNHFARPRPQAPTGGDDVAGVGSSRVTTPCCRRRLATHPLGSHHKPPQGSTHRWQWRGRSGAGRA